MLLPAIEDELEAWVRAERYLGLGTQDYSRRATTSTASPEYRPDSRAASFQLPTRLVPASAARILTPAPACARLAGYRKQDQVVFPLHPDAYATMDAASRSTWDSWPEGPAMTVAPLANTRTVVVLGNAPGWQARRHFLKLHFPGVLSRFRRPQCEREVEHQLRVSGELEKAGVPLLSDAAGITYHGGQGTPWGFLMRDPYQVISPRSLVVPAFALYGKDRLSLSDPVILRQLIGLSRLDSETYISECLVRPIVRLWAETALRSGFLLAMHGQNVLYRASLGTGLGDVFYRGCSVYVDESLRGKTDLSQDKPHRKILLLSQKARSAAVRSLIYDSFTGHHLLDYIDRLAESELGVRPGRLAVAARDEFKRSGGSEISMPATIHYYRDTPETAAGDSATEIQDTGILPKWR